MFLAILTKGIYNEFTVLFLFLHFLLYAFFIPYCFHFFFRADAAASIKRQGYKYLDRCKFLVSSPIFVIVSLHCYTIITLCSNNDPRTYCTHTTVLLQRTDPQIPIFYFQTLKITETVSFFAAQDMLAF